MATNSAFGIGFYKICSSLCTYNTMSKAVQVIDPLENVNKQSRYCYRAYFIDLVAFDFWVVKEDKATSGIGSVTLQ